MVFYEGFFQLSLLMNHPFQFQEFFQHHFIIQFLCFIMNLNLLLQFQCAILIQEWLLLLIIGLIDSIDNCIIDISIMILLIILIC
ncbi:unnamed protein product (macronuclear) [Paramecium tetraurelia]|uniref:Uncharacterized protein n=1 Tax=Paramecium tetraurelia TaxID=5888 RepID=A0D461_PARTE|nr:uncharacterized protein GSPATT00013294001 [Paramecium tetraurelia]CAK77828.1 unnamed protein product [Paramecium tetraurelia]|eukprot:XP_001445225.1 hypothetical protein (macronuclear) [Paramecium tetraurelia strain d4-2]